MKSCYIVSDNFISYLIISPCTISYYYNSYSTKSCCIVSGYYTSFSIISSCTSSYYFISYSFISYFPVFYYYISLFRLVVYRNFQSHLILDYLALCHSWLHARKRFVLYYVLTTTPHSQSSRLGKFSTI